MDTLGSVIYLGGIHGPITPGTSLDWIVAPKIVIQSLLAAVRREYQFPSELNQLILNELLESNALDRFFESQREFIRERRRICLGILERHLSGLADWSGPQAWGRIWMRLPEQISVQKLYLQRRDVDFHPGSLYGPTNAIQLYLFQPPEVFEEGIRRLRKLIREVCAI